MISQSQKDNTNHEPCAQTRLKSMALEDKLFLVKTRKAPKAHISIVEEKCRACGHKICLVVCPAKTYEEREGKIEASYENCLECGSCRVACVAGAIVWDNPKGGFGISYING